MGLVLEGNGLVGGADDDLMLPHDIAHTDGVDADLIGGALPRSASTRDHGGVGSDLAQSVGDGQGGAAGGIQLAVVVLLDATAARNMARPISRSIRLALKVV